MPQLSGRRQSGQGNKATQPRKKRTTMKLLDLMGSLSMALLTDGKIKSAYEDAEKEIAETYAKFYADPSEDVEKELSFAMKKYRQAKYNLDGQEILVKHLHGRIEDVMRAQEIKYICLEGGYEISVENAGELPSG